MHSIEQITEGTISGFISEFIEPYLNISIKHKKEAYIIEVSYVYDTQDEWKSWNIKQIMDSKELLNLKNDFQNMYDTHPSRK